MAEDAYAFEFEGQEYRLRTLMLSEARAIQKVTRKTMGDFDDALAKGDVDCYAALIWVARKRQEPTLTFEQVDGDLMTFKALDEDEDEPRAEGNGQEQLTVQSPDPDGTSPTTAGT